LVEKLAGDWRGETLAITEKRGKEAIISFSGLEVKSPRERNRNESNRRDTKSIKIMGQITGTRDISLLLQGGQLEEETDWQKEKFREWLPFAKERRGDSRHNQSRDMERITLWEE